jgi:hypothetical protein
MTIGQPPDRQLAASSEARAAAEPLPVAATAFQQAVNLAVGRHDRHHRTAGEPVGGRHRPDGDAVQGGAEPADVAFAGLDDRISVGDAGDLTAQPQRRTANEQERHLLGGNDGRAEDSGREGGQERSPPG